MVANHRQSTPSSITPFHIFNPPPGKQTLTARLTLGHGVASSISDGQPPIYYFSLQLSQRQQMRPALRVLPHPAGTAGSFCFYIRPASDTSPFEPSAAPELNLGGQ